MRLDLARGTVTRSAKAANLAPREFELLLALPRCRGAVATRLELLKEGWGCSSAAATRTVDTHIAGLRRKLEADPASPRHILRVRKIGYLLQV